MFRIIPRQFYHPKTHPEKKKSVLAFTQMDKTWRGLTRQWFMIRRWTIQGSLPGRRKRNDSNAGALFSDAPLALALFFPSKRFWFFFFLVLFPDIAGRFLSISRSAALTGSHSGLAGSPAGRQAHWHRKGPEYWNEQLTRRVSEKRDGKCQEGPKETDYYY